MSRFCSLFLSWLTQTPSCVRAGSGPGFPEFRAGDLLTPVAPDCFRHELVSCPFHDIWIPVHPAASVGWVSLPRTSAVNTWGCLTDLLRDLDMDLPLNILFCDHHGVCGACVAGSPKSENHTLVNPHRDQIRGCAGCIRPVFWGEGRDPVYLWGPELDPCGSKFWPMGPQGCSPESRTSSLRGSPLAPI